METFQVSILAAENNLYQGECESIVVPTYEGARGIMAHHCNIIEAIAPGKLEYTIPGQEKKLAFVSSGMLKVEDGEVLVLVDSAERPEDIEKNKARRAEEKAKEERLQKTSRQEYILNQAFLARTINRFKTKNDYDQW